MVMLYADEILYVFEDPAAEVDPAIPRLPVTLDLSHIAVARERCSILAEKGDGWT